MSEIKVGQIWSGIDDVLIMDIIQIPGEDLQIVVRNNADPNGTWYNISEQRLRDFYSLKPEQSQCTKCGAINEYVQEKSYTCYKCRSEF